MRRTETKAKRICLTGGIACGKSLLSHYLNALGIATVDADDIVHGLLPDPEERARIAREVFADPSKRKALEARLHPLVREQIDRAFAASGADEILVAVIPLLFEVQWDADYDIICCIASSRDTQISRMMATRGYSRDVAEARLAAQMPVEEKVAKSHYVIRNDGSADDLRREAGQFAAWLRARVRG